MKLIIVAIVALASSLALVSPSVANHTFPHEEPWLGLAMIHTQTTGGVDRVYTISVEDVSVGTSGDRAVWNYAHDAPLTLRFEWTIFNSAFTGQATSANVFFRHPDGGQIGTPWPVTITPNESSGVAIKTIHLDDNPMDGVVGAGPLGVYELYGQLVGGNDNGADTRGAPAVGTAPGLGKHARGLFSNNGLKLYDHWNRPNGASWKSTKWTTNANGTSRILDSQGDRGRIYGNSTARATAQMADLADAEVNLVYEF